MLVQDGPAVCRTIAPTLKVGGIGGARKGERREQRIKAITPLLGYQQMQTAPCFILLYHEKMAYEINNWIQSLKNMADMRLPRRGGRGGTKGEDRPPAQGG